MAGPVVIVSPWARPGYTDSTPASFSSTLAFTTVVSRVPASSRSYLASHPMGDHADDS